MYWHDIINKSTNTGIDYWKKIVYELEPSIQNIRVYFNFFLFHEFKFFIYSFTFVTITIIAFL